MNGIQYVVHEKGQTVAVQIDIKKNKALWEDIQDNLVSRSRRHEKSIPLEEVRADLIKRENYVDEYRVAVKPSAKKELGDLSESLIERIFQRLCGLSANPRPAGCKKLKNGEKEWRIRVGDYRVIYTIEDSVRLVEVTRIRHRREVLKPIGCIHT